MAQWKIHPFERPFDVRVRDMMLATTEALLTEFDAAYGYTQSDEISLLFSIGCDLYSRKLRKLNSVLAGFASARFALALNSMASFDSRISELPTAKDVVDYFRWRQADASRNALSAHCYWALRAEGSTGAAANEILLGLPAESKLELLERRGVRFSELPSWQRCGCGLYWEEHEKVGFNPVSQQSVVARRRRVTQNLELPVHDAYSEFLQLMIERDSRGGGSGEAD